MIPRRSPDNLVWGIFLVPYRLVRRHHRKAKLDARRHAELVKALERGGR